METNLFLSYIIFTTGLIIVFMTIYFFCINSKIKKHKNNELNKKSFKLKKNNFSFTNLDQKSSFDEESVKPTVLPIQKSFECFQCKKKLSGYYKKDFFAYDREYCETCWNRIHFKIINNYS